MTITSTQNNIKTRFVYFVGGLLLFLTALAWPGTAFGQGIAYDPYADSVADTAAVVLDANNAVGSPNGTSASLVGPGSSLTLDMGTGEEGTQTLRLYVAQINAQVNVDVTFLDQNKAVIRSENRQLGVDVNPSVQNFAYNWTDFGKAYRFVRISSMAGGGVNVDAVEALGYLGSTPTQDTDGDGVPDRTEHDNGTDPLVPDNPKQTNPAPTTNGHNGANGVSAQVNNPPAANGDQDGDGMADDWERTHGLDPTDPKDASKDPDHDGLKNLTEYQINSDPQKLDTDGDGMPDKWEYDNGLDVNTNDADGDPDGDFLTNLGEYRHNTDPNKADDLYKVFGTNCFTNKGVWLVGLLLLIAAFMAGKMTNRPTKTTKKSSKNTKR